MDLVFDLTHLSRGQEVYQQLRQTFPSLPESWHIVCSMRFCPLFSDKAIAFRTLI